jgi:hypothetical protein
MRRPLRWLIATAVASLAVAALAATALADGPRPTVESESASGITETDATLEAEINPGSGEDGVSLATTYEFFLESPWCGSQLPFGACEAIGGKLVYKGVLPAGSAPQLVSVDLASVEQTLSPGTTYGYRVVATNGAGQAFGWEKTFTTLPGGKPPVIESVAVSNLTTTDATLEAKIDTEGLTTFYAFQMWSSPCSKQGVGCELINDVPLPCCGVLFGSFVGQSVSLDLKSVGVTLGSGEYGFSVTATNQEGSTEASGGVFEVPPGVTDPPGPTVTSGPSGQTSGASASSGGAQSAASGGASPTTLGTSSALGASSKTGAGEAGGKPKVKHGKHHKHKHHPTNAAKHPAKSKKHKQ